MGDDPDPEAAVQVLKRLGEGKEHIHKPEFVKSVIWCLQRLLQSGHDELVEEGARLFFQLYDRSIPLLQNQLLHGVFSQENSFLTLLLCNRSLVANSTFPRHLLVDSYFDVDFTARFTEAYVMCKGMNSSFNLGVASNGEVVEPRMVPFREKITKVSMSNTHTLFLSASGTVFGCGQGAHGQLGPSMKKLVVEPTVIHLPTKGCPVIDLVACEKYSVFVTQKSVLVCGEVSHSDIGSTREQPIRRFDLGEQDHFLYSVCASSDRVIVAATRTNDWLAGKTVVGGNRFPTFAQVTEIHNQYYRCGEDGHFMFHMGVTDLRGTAQLNFGWFFHPELYDYQLSSKIQNRRVVRLPFNRGHLKTVQAQLKLKTRTSIHERGHRSHIGYLIATFDCHSLHFAECLFSVNGTLVKLNVVQFDATKDGEVVVLAFSLRDDDVADETHPSAVGSPSVHRIPSQQHLAGMSLYKGRAVVVSEPLENDDFVICSRDDRDKAFFGLKILLELQEIPGTHSVRHFAMSPNGENVVYLVDSDEINVQNIPFVGRLLNIAVSYDTQGPALPKSLRNDFQRNWAVLDIGALNGMRVDNGYEPMEYDLSVIDSLLPKERAISSADCSFHTVLELAKTRFPQVEQFVSNGQLSIRKLSEKCGDYVTSLIIHYLRGRDRFHPHEIYQDCLSKAIYQKQPIEKTEVSYMGYRQKYLSDIKKDLAAVGLTLTEENYDTWRIRPATADRVVTVLEKDVDIKTIDGVLHPFNRMVLTLQSHYFEAALSHMPEGSALKLDFPSPVVEIALRVLLDPMHLYEIDYSQLFPLLDLLDQYLFDAAVEDCLWVIFDRANEFNLQHLFECYHRMEHFRMAMTDLFAQRMHLLSFWRGSSSAPLSLIQEMANRLAPREHRFMSVNGVGKGGSMVHANILPLPPISWSVLSFMDVQRLLLGDAADEISIKQLDALYKKAEASRRLATEERQTLPYPPPFLYELFEADAPPTLVRQLLKTRHARPRRVSDHVKDITAASPPSPSVIPSAFEKLEEEFSHLDVEETPKKGRFESSDEPQFDSGDSKEAEEEKMEEVGIGREVLLEEACSPPAFSPPNRWGVMPSTPPVTASVLRLDETPKKSTEKFISKGRKFHKLEMDKQQPKSSVAPWLAASTSSASSSPMSLRDIQKQELETVKATPPREIQKTPRTRKNTWTEEASPSPQQKPVSLSRIMAEEEQRNAPVVPISRPLEFVEKEEQAVLELQQMYEEQYGDSVMVTVEIVSSTPSVSRWDGHGPRR